MIFIYFQRNLDKFPKPPNLDHRLSIKKKITLHADLFHINGWSDLQEKLKDEYNFINLGIKCLFLNWINI